MLIAHVRHGYSYDGIIENLGHNDVNVMVQSFTEGIKTLIRPIINDEQ
jgi:hypothetical protein